MGRPLRMFEPDKLYFVTARAIQGRLLLRPEARVNDLVGGIIAKGQKKFSIRIYGLVVLSNHLHAVLGADKPQNISAFMQWVLSLIAKKVGKHIDWREKFWGRRFSAEPILDDEAAKGRLTYILAHAQKEGLTARPELWPGLTCIPEVVHGVRRLFHWCDETEMGRSKRRGDNRSEGQFKERLGIDYERLPCWQGLDDAQYSKVIKALLEEAVALADELRAGKTGCLGAEAVVAQHPHDKPKQSKKSTRPLCHASTMEAYEAFRATYRAFVAAYREAAAALRAGDVNVAFPRHAFLPPLGCGWVPASLPTAPA